MVLKLTVFLTFIQQYLCFECQFSDHVGLNDRAGAFSSDLWFWPQHRVYFWFDSSINKDDRKIIWKYMKEIERNTCIKFEETPKRRYKYLTIHTEKSFDCTYCKLMGLHCPLKNGGTVRTSPFCNKEFDCPYYYGSVTMKLSIRLPFCGQSQRWKKLIVHELLHVLGLIHTQNRVDRDKYISINKDAIDKKSIDQYLPKCHSCPTFNLPYECNSVMHYGWMDFASAGRLMAFFKPTMTSKHPSCHLTSDGGSNPTEADWEMARRIQRCGFVESRP